MNLKRFKWIYILITMISLQVIVFSATSIVCAASTSKAKESIDPDKKCSFKLLFSDYTENDNLLNEEIQLFKIADLDADMQFSLIDLFSSYDFEINGIKAQSEWNALTGTIGSYITADKIEYLSAQSINESGAVLFPDLRVGLYYVRFGQSVDASNAYYFEPFLVVLPGLNEAGKWNYAVDVYAKTSAPPPLPESYTVIKQWKDTGSSSNRPETINVELFRNGSFDRSVVLQETNNWTYTWTSEKGDRWTAVERSVPKGYTVTIEENNGTFIITNSVANNPPVTPPQTGDPINTSLYLIIMMISALLITALSLVTLKKRDR